MSGNANPAVRRIMREAKDIRTTPCREFTAYPVEDNAFEWVFTLRGPEDSEYENGFYRGRLKIPHNYPFAPPDIMLLTPNGRFELDKKICISISSYHPENWNPVWGISTVLLALREFMSTPGNNAIGAIEYPKEKRKQLARESHDFICPITQSAIKDDIEVMNSAPASASVPPPFTPPVNPAEDPAVPPPAPLPAAAGVTEAEPAAPTTAAASAVPAPAPKPETKAPESQEGPAAAPAEAAPAQPGAAAAAPAQQPAAPAEAPASPARAAAPRREAPNVVIDEGFIDALIFILATIVLAILAKKATVFYYTGLTFV